MQEEEEKERKSWLGDDENRPIWEQEQKEWIDDPNRVKSKEELEAEKWIKEENERDEKRWANIS